MDITQAVAFTGLNDVASASLTALAKPRRHGPRRPGNSPRCRNSHFRQSLLENVKLPAKLAMVAVLLAK